MPYLYSLLSRDSSMSNDESEAMQNKQLTWHQGTTNIELGKQKKASSRVVSRR
jgi:hypothetical protein